MKISLKNLDKQDVLIALYNAAKPQGLGFLHFQPEPMSRDEAQRLLSQDNYFDYVKGRVMKVDLGGDAFETWLYDRDNGRDAAKRALEEASLTVEEVQL